MHMQSMTHHAASSMHCPRLQQQAKGKMACMYAAVQPYAAVQQQKDIFASTHSLCISIVPFCFCMLAVCCAAHKPCGTLQEKHRWQMAAAEAGLKVVHDLWVVYFWCGQPAAVRCHAFCCPNGPVRPRLSAVCDDPCCVQLPVGRQVHVGGFCEHCHHSWRCEASSVSLLPGLSAFWLLQGSPKMLRAMLPLFMVTSATCTRFLCVFILVILTVPYAVPKDLQQTTGCNTSIHGLVSCYHSCSSEHFLLL